MATPSKGGKRITVRVPWSQVPRLHDEAAARGLPLSDYAAMVLAASHGLEPPAYLHQTKQDQLPEAV